MTLSTIDLDDPQTVWRDERAKSVSFFCRKKPVRVGPELIAELKRLADRSRQNVRVCLHESPDSRFHEMVILEHGGRYYRPHKHREKGESFHIIEGALAVFVFDEQGTMQDSCLLEPGGAMIYRLGDEMYHAVLPVTDRVIYHESKLGPFLGEGDSLWAPWAPDGSDSGEVQAFRDKLLAAVGHTRRAGEE